MQKMTNDFINEIKNNQTWLKIIGGALFLLGVIFLFLFFTGFLNPNLAGVISFMVGVLLFVYTLRFWPNHSTGFIIFTLTSVFYLFMAVFYLRSFILMLYVVLLFCAIFFILACFKIYTGFSQIFTGLGWSYTILSGIVNLIFVLITMYSFEIFPPSLILACMGFDMLFTGYSFIALSAGAKRLNSSDASTGEDISLSDNH